MGIHNFRSLLIGEVRKGLDRTTARAALLRRDPNQRWFDLLRAAVMGVRVADHKPQTPSVALHVLLCLCVVVLVLGGPKETPCAEADNQSAGSGTAQSKVERGPVRVAVDLKPSPARVSDDLTLAVTIDCQSGVTVRKQEVRASPADFVVREFREVPRRTEGDSDVLQRVYTLEPARAGRLTIQSVSVTFAEIQAGGGGAEVTVETGAIGVDVTSMVAGVPSLEMLRGAAGPVGLPKSSGATGWIVIAVAAAAVVAAASLVWLRARGQPAAAVVGLSPREEARKGLQRLFAEGWVARDIKWFYSELTAVVRRYLERTMGIHALEQTTEESLRAVAARRSFPAEAAARLRGLLESADLVKFAAHRPEQNEIEENIQRATFCIELRWGEVEP